MLKFDLLLTPFAMRYRVQKKLFDQQHAVYKEWYVFGVRMFSLQIMYEI